MVVKSTKSVRYFTRSLFQISGHLTVFRTWWPTSNER